MLFYQVYIPSIRNQLLLKVADKFILGITDIFLNPPSFFNLLLTLIRSLGIGIDFFSDLLLCPTSLLDNINSDESTYIFVFYKNNFIYPYIYLWLIVFNYIILY